MSEKLPKKLNAVKHGLLSKQIIINPQESRPFNKLAKQLLAELQPTTAIEMIMAEQVILQYWRLQRFMKIENELFLYAGESKFSFGDARFVVAFAEFLDRNPSFDVLSRYNASILRGFYKALHEYRNIKRASNLSKTGEIPNDL